MHLLRCAFCMGWAPCSMLHDCRHEHGVRTSCSAKSSDESLSICCRLLCGLCRLVKYVVCFRPYASRSTAAQQCYAAVAVALTASHWNVGTATPVTKLCDREKVAHTDQSKTQPHEPLEKSSAGKSPWATGQKVRGARSGGRRAGKHARDCEK